MRQPLKDLLANDLEQVSGRERACMHSIFYIIGVIVVVVFILKFLGVW
jgi:hypothetical protein